MEGAWNLVEDDEEGFQVEVTSDWMIIRPDLGRAGSKGPVVGVSVSSRAGLCFHAPYLFISKLFLRGPRPAGWKGGL